MFVRPVGSQAWLQQRLLLCNGFVNQRFGDDPHMELGASQWCCDLPDRNPEDTSKYLFVVAQGFDSHMPSWGRDEARDALLEVFRVWIAWFFLGGCYQKPRTSWVLVDFLVLNKKATQTLRFHSLKGGRFCSQPEVSNQERTTKVTSSHWRLILNKYLIIDRT